MSTQASYPAAAAQINFVLTIKQSSFLTTISVFFALTILSLLGRIAVGVCYRRKFAPDDFTLLLGCASFIAGTGIVYSLSNELYAAYQQPSRIDAYTSGASTHLPIYTQAFTALIWITIFSVKLSFLAFFYRVIHTQRDIRRYYWAVATVTAISGIYEVCSYSIFCPHTGLDAVKCFLTGNRLQFKLMMGFTAGLDALTDLLIVSIPILVLRRTTLRLTQKIIVGTFLSLSLVMVIITCIRVSKLSPGSRGYDTLWQMLWLYIEGATAILMASLTVYRALFNMQRETRRTNERLKKPSTSDDYRQHDNKEDVVERSWLESPTPAERRLQAQVRRNDRLENVTVATVTSDGGVSEDGDDGLYTMYVLDKAGISDGGQRTFFR